MAITHLFEKNSHSSLIQSSTLEVLNIPCALQSQLIHYFDPIFHAISRHEKRIRS